MQLFAALLELPGQVLFSYPNADAGSRELIQRTEQFLEQRPRMPACSSILAL